MLGITKKRLSQVKQLNRLLGMLGIAGGYKGQIGKHHLKFVRLNYAIGRQGRVNHLLKTLSAWFSVGA